MWWVSSLQRPACEWNLSEIPDWNLDDRYCCGRTHTFKAVTAWGENLGMDVRESNNCSTSESTQHLLTSEVAPQILLPPYPIIYQCLHESKQCIFFHARMQGQDWSYCFFQVRRLDVRFQGRDLMMPDVTHQMRPLIQYFASLHLSYFGIDYGIYVGAGTSRWWGSLMRPTEFRFSRAYSWVCVP